MQHTRVHQGTSLSKPSETFYVPSLPSDHPLTPLVATFLYCHHVLQYHCGFFLTKHSSLVCKPGLQDTVSDAEKALLTAESLGFNFSLNAWCLGMSTHSFTQKVQWSTDSEENTDTSHNIRSSRWVCSGQTKVRGQTKIERKYPLEQESPNVTHRNRRIIISDGRFRHSRFSFTKSSSISIWVRWPKRAILASGTIQSANLNKRWSKRESWCRKMNSQTGTLQLGPKRERRRKPVATASSGKVRTDEDPSGTTCGTGGWPSCTSASRRLRVEQLGRQQFVTQSCLRMLHWSYLLICSLFCQPWNNKETPVIWLVSYSWEDN